MTHQITPAHMIMLRGALTTKPSYDMTWFPSYYDSRRLTDSARALARWNRITRPVLEFAELARLPLGLVLLAMGKGV